MEKIAVFAVLLDIAALAQALCAHALKKSGRADEAKAPARAAHGGKHLFRAHARRADGDIADALARKRERLREGIAEDGVLIHIHGIGHLLAVGELAVGLVGDEEDRPILTLFFEQPSERRELFFVIHDARGVVGRIDEDALRMFVDGLLHGGKVDMEARVRWNFAADAPAASMKTRYSGK